ncbi:MAG: DUF4190 domain-containing protein [Phycisphaerales bacterium]|nr:DUF4190 domain-containing protein [Phycisphaerales bacterium]
MTQPDQPRFGDFGNTPPEPYAESPTRLSILAVASLVTGILSFIGCCIPVVGLIPTGLGVGALIRIQRSRGKISGNGLAIGGLVMGIFSLVLSGGIWIGASMIGSRLGPVYSQALSDDPAVVRTVLTSSAAADVTDERIADFHQALAAAHGNVVETPKGIWPLIMAYNRVGRDPKSVTDTLGDPGGTVLPLPMEFERGWDFVVVIMSPTEQLGSSLPGLMNIGFVDDAGKVVWLLEKSGAAPAEGESPSSPPTDEGTETPAPDPGA